MLETPKATYIWHGKSAGDSEKLVGQNVARILTPNREATILAEESEPTDFWQSLGGYKTYAKEKCVDNIPIVHEPRLLQVSSRIIVQLMRTSVDTQIHSLDPL